jgi:hypothetical protein
MIDRFACGIAASIGQSGGSIVASSCRPRCTKVESTELMLACSGRVRSPVVASSFTALQ